MVGYVEPPTELWVGAARERVFLFLYLSVCLYCVERTFLRHKGSR